VADSSDCFDMREWRCPAFHWIQKIDEGLSPFSRFKMKKRLPFNFVLVSAMLLMFSCSRNNTPKQTRDVVIEDFRHNLTAADSSWQIMMNSDDGKIQNMDRLVSELLLIDGSDSVALHTIQSGIEGLKKERYSRFNIRRAGIIDRYDSLTTSLIVNLKKEVSRNPKAEQFQIVNQLVNEISLADDSVLFYRKEYDRFADKLNLSMKKNKKKLKDEFQGIDSIASYPVFRLVP